MSKLKSIGAWGMRHKIISIIVIALFIIMGVSGAFNSGDTAAQPDKQSRSEQVRAKAEKKTAERKVRAEERQNDTVAEGVDFKTTGGIDYGTASVACDKAARKRLFEGRSYNSDPILGMQKWQQGLDESEGLARYNVTVDGQKMAINCLVGGTKDKPSVVQVSKADAS